MFGPGWSGLVVSRESVVAGRFPHLHETRTHKITTMETLPADNNAVLGTASGSSQSEAGVERGGISTTVRRRNHDVKAEEEEELKETAPALDRRSLLNSRLPTVPFARGLRARRGSGVFGVLEYLWVINGNFREASGALGVSVCVCVCAFALSLHVGGN